MGRKRKQRTESELLEMLETAANKRKDAERRMQEARRNETAVQKDLEDLRTAQRLRRMSVLLSELERIGYPMDSDDAVPAIIGKIQNNVSAGCDDEELLTLQSLREVIEKSTTVPMRTSADVSGLNAALNLPRDLRARKSVTIAQVITYAITGKFPPHRSSVSEEAG